jgi:hypothetical protein
MLFMAITAPITRPPTAAGGKEKLVTLHCSL